MTLSPHHEPGCARPMLFHTRGRVPRSCISSIVNPIHVKNLDTCRLDVRFYPSLSVIQAHAHVRCRARLVQLPFNTLAGSDDSRCICITSQQSQLRPAEGMRYPSFVEITLWLHDNLTGADMLECHIALPHHALDCDLRHGVIGRGKNVRFPLV